ncbi:hypothetical protein NLG97_g9194 [Lecanicillium saksenae]|uniref:Uncharacterized protein n=1 Tax=Lecanicillium saksenae TaxID=468837 RepID=A0ACC1QK27_9HYPO|nr:hypothetical protein NLG97_g9194 [Lecanicillium saksenae]
MEDRGTPRVRELDLRECKVSSTFDDIDVVRSIKSSAARKAFFTFLRANLALSPDMITSPTSTPQLDPFSAPADAIPPEVTAPAPAAGPAAAAAAPSKPASSSHAAPDLVPLEDIPELSLDPLQTEEEQKEGLKLLADTLPRAL